MTLDDIKEMIAARIFRLNSYIGELDNEAAEIENYAKKEELLRLLGEISEAEMREGE